MQVGSPRSPRERKARMELRRHLDVLWRYRVIVVAGIVVGFLLAAAALFRLTEGSLDYRQKPVYSSTSTVYVTQPGFPEGRILAEVPGDTESGASSESPKQTDTSGEFFADPSRFSSLALLYSYLLSSDELKSRMGPLPRDSEILAEPVVDGTGSRATTLPLIAVTVLASDRGEAVRLNKTAIKTLRAYIAEKQQTNNVLTEDRVQLEVLSPPGTPEVAESRSYTGAIVLFVLATMLAVGLAYVLENLRSQPAISDAEWDVEDWSVSTNGAGDVPDDAERVFAPVDGEPLGPPER
jgi:hypothetical protein